LYYSSHFITRATLLKELFWYSIFSGTAAILSQQRLWYSRSLAFIVFAVVIIFNVPMLLSARVYANINNLHVKIDLLGTSLQIRSNCPHVFFLHR